MSQQQQQYELEQRILKVRNAFAHDAATYEVKRVNVNDIGEKARRTCIKEILFEYFSYRAPAMEDEDQDDEPLFTTALYVGYNFYDQQLFQMPASSAIVEYYYD